MDNQRNDVLSYCRFDRYIPKGTVADLSYIEFSTISRTLAQYLKKVTNSPESSPHQSILLVAKCVFPNFGSASAKLTPVNATAFL